MTTEPGELSYHSISDYEVGQDNIRPLGFDIHNPVFLISGGLIVAFVAFALLFPSAADDFFGWLRPALTSTFDWVFLIAANIFVLFCLFLVLSPYGSIRLGGRDARPDWSYIAWFSMLFAAGMGIGLVFYGVAEPATHFAASLAEDPSAAPLAGASGNVEAARRLGMAATIFHWGLHPWAIYATVALALAFFCYNWGLPLTMRSAFYPVLGERVWGWSGHIVDTLAVFATLFGLATSLGFGAEQAAAGLNYLFGIPDTLTSNVILIIAITAVALTSVVAGLDSGVKRLSELNMGLAALLLLFIFLVGPTLTLLSGFFGNTVAYVREIIPLSNPFGRSDDAFRTGWTTFYWAWWMSWSPFVGMFIARVSRGRTIREFIICVLIIPTVASILWMTVFGGTALSLTISGFEGITEAPLELKMFAMLGQLPLTAITSFVGIILVIVFFCTSSDSGSLVIDTITAGGKVDAPVSQRVFWASLEGLVAIALLVGGGLAALQGAAIATGFPFAFLLLALCWSLFVGIRREHKSPFREQAEGTAAE